MRTVSRFRFTERLKIPPSKMMTQSPLGSTVGCVNTPNSCASSAGMNARISSAVVASRDISTLLWELRFQPGTHDFGVLRYEVPPNVVEPPCDLVLDLLDGRREAVPDDL